MAHHTAADRANLENVTATARRTDPNVANSIDFLTGVPIGFFDNQQGLPSSLTQGEGYQTGISDDIQRQINEGLALQQAQHEEKMAEELAEELAENLESEVPDSVESALVDASQNMSLIDRIVQGAMARFGPTAGIRALNELFSILPGTGRITGGIEGLLDLGDEWVGDLASRNLFSRAIDRLAPAERAGRGAIESVENRYSKIVDPIKMGMEWMRIMQNPLAEVAGMAFEGKPNAQRLVRSALTPPPPGMAQGGAVNYNNPLMMRRGGMTRRRRGRRGGVDSLMARRRRLSPAEARRRQRREEVIDREAGPMVPLGGAPGSPHDPFRSRPGMLAAKYRRDQRARERQRQRQVPLERQRLSDNRAAIEQRLLAEQAARDSYQPLYYGPTERARDAAISRYQKMLDMEEDLAGGPLLGVPTPVTGGDQIRFGPDGQMLPPLTAITSEMQDDLAGALLGAPRQPLQDHRGGGYRLGTGYEPRRGQPGYRPPSPQSQVRDQRSRYMPERRSPRQMPGSERDIRMRRMIEDVRSGGRGVPGEDYIPLIPESPGSRRSQQIPASQQDALQQMLDLLGANERLLNPRRNPIRNIGPDRAESFRRGGAIDPFARYRARRR
jgi:hypothetical protein